MTTDPRPIAAVSLDADNQWSYMKTHGDTGWESFPSYLDVLMPYTCDLFDELGIRITYFIVGQDAALPINREALALVTARGHEVGNHSFKHEPWLHRYSRAEIRDELARAEGAIGEACGVRPVGFRGPGSRCRRTSSRHSPIAVTPTTVRRCRRGSGRSPAPTTSGRRS
jgi:peptidoglycan/xylan/chitin deacetylase (PgdA/CDA1 family)